MVICVDLDGTLSEEMDDWRKYAEAPPIEENIAKVRRMYEAGHTIIIYTARPMDDWRVTKRWLYQNNVPYERLEMGKFRGDLYIDNNSIRMEEIDDTVIQRWT